MKFKSLMSLLVIAGIALFAWAGLEDLSNAANMPAEIPDAQTALHGKIPGDRQTITNVEAIVGSIVTNMIYQKYQAEDLRNCFWSPSSRIFYRGEIKRIDGEDRMYYIAITNVNLFTLGVPDALKQ